MSTKLRFEQISGTLSEAYSININNATRNFRIHNSLDATGNDISAFEYGTDGKGGNYVLIGGPVGDIGDPDSIPIKGLYLHSQDMYFVGSTGGGNVNQATLNIKHDSFSVENNDGGSGGRNSAISFNTNTSLYLETLRDSGGNTSSRSIDFGSAIGNEFLITDNDTSKGFVYAADYSANFTPRSLVDEGYVLPRSGGTITGSFSVDGFSTLGDSSVGIKTKTVTITTGAPGGSGAYQVVHGLSASKIVSFTAVGHAQDGSVVLPESAAVANSLYTANLTATNCRVTLQAADTNMHNSDVIFYITYIE